MGRLTGQRKQVIVGIRYDSDSCLCKCEVSPEPWACERQRAPVRRDQRKDKIDDMVRGVLAKPGFRLTMLPTIQVISLLLACSLHNDLNCHFHEQS